MSERTWACMVPDGLQWCVYAVDTDKGYIESVAQELRDGGHEAGIMELF